MDVSGTQANAFGLRWLQDHDLGRLVYCPATREFRTPADAIRRLHKVDGTEAAVALVRAEEGPLPG